MGESIKYTIKSAVSKCNITSNQCAIINVRPRLFVRKVRVDRVPMCVCV